MKKRRTQAESDFASEIRWLPDQGSQVIINAGSYVPFLNEESLAGNFVMAWLDASGARSRIVADVTP